MALLKLFVSFLATNIVLLALLLFTFPYSLYRLVTFENSSNSEHKLEPLLQILQSKGFFEHLTYFAALAALFVYLNNNYQAIKSPYLKRTWHKKKITKRKNKTRSNYLSLREDIRLKLFLLESYKNKELKPIEEQIKNEIRQKKTSANQKQKLTKAFEKIERKYGEFKCGDIAVSTSNRLLKVSHDLSIEKAEELLKNGLLKEFYPIESQVDIE